MRPLENPSGGVAQISCPNIEGKINENSRAIEDEDDKYLQIIKERLEL